MALAEINRIKVIGCGGIGSWLSEPLCRFLNYHEKYRDQVEVTLIDGDNYEDRNAERQVFSGFGNKAKESAARLQENFPSILFDHVPEYLTDDNIIPNVRNGDIVFLCVDNHATRKLISDHCQTLDSVLVISGGNDYSDGNVMIYHRENGEDKTIPLASEFHPEIMDPDDENPGDVEERDAGCDVLSVSDPQLLFANLNAATIMLNSFYSYLQGKLNWDEVYFDVSNSSTSKRNRLTN